MQLDNRNAVITYTVVFLIIFFASMYIVLHSGFHLQYLVTKFGSKSADEDMNEIESQEKRLQETGDELSAYVEKLAQDENSVFMNDNESTKKMSRRAGYESGNEQTGDASGDLSYNPSRIPVSFSEFGKTNNSKDDMTSDALNNIKRNYLNIVGLKKEDAEAAKNSHYARLEKLDENLLSSKERQWRKDEENRRRKRVVSKRGATSESYDFPSESLGTNNGTNLFLQAALKDTIDVERNDTKLNIASVQMLNSTNNLNAVGGNTSVLEPQNEMLKTQCTKDISLKSWNALEQNEIPFSNSIRTMYLKEPKVLSLPSDYNIKFNRDQAIDQGKRMIKRDDAVNLENEQKSKATTPCDTNDPSAVANFGKPANPAKPVTKAPVKVTPGSKPGGTDSSQCVNTNENPGVVDVDSDGDDIAAAKLINGFMQSVMDQASKTGNLKTELGLGRKNDVEYQSFTNINKTVTNEFMSNVFCCVDKLVENTMAKQVCGQLPPDMKRFLDWLLKSGVSKEQACRAQKTNGETEFANFVFSYGASKNETGRRNVNLVGLDVEEEEQQKFLNEADNYFKNLK